MNKEELYDPVKQGTFRMMFGFPQPTRMVRKITYSKEFYFDYKNIINNPK